MIYLRFKDLFNFKFLKLSLHKKINILIHRMVMNNKRPIQIYQNLFHKPKFETYGSQTAV